MELLQMEQNRLAHMEIMLVAPPFDFLRKLFLGWPPKILWILLFGLGKEIHL